MRRKIGWVVGGCLVIFLSASAVLYAQDAASIKNQIDQHRDEIRRHKEAIRNLVAQLRALGHSLPGEETSGVYGSEESGAISQGPKPPLQGPAAEKIKDRLEDRRDKIEDLRDRGENRLDRLEDIRGRKEDARDRREDIRDHREDARDRRPYGEGAPGARDHGRGVGTGQGQGGIHRSPQAMPHGSGRPEGAKPGSGAHGGGRAGGARQAPAGRR